jgi:hypothetical protein
MATYKELPMGTIERINDDGSLSYIPVNPANSDYQEYLNKDKAEQSTPIVTEE